jgi:hypothetical protein
LSKLVFPPSCLYGRQTYLRADSGLSTLSPSVPSNHYTVLTSLLQAMHSGEFNDSNTSVYQRACWEMTSTPRNDGRERRKSGVLAFEIVMIESTSLPFPSYRNPLSIASMIHIHHSRLTSQTVLSSTTESTHMSLRSSHTSEI